MFQQVFLISQWLELIQMPTPNHLLANKNKITMVSLYQGFSTSALLIFRDGQFFAVYVGSVLCIVGYLTASLASVTQVSVATPLAPVMTTKNVSRHCQMSLMVGINHLQLRITGLRPISIDLCTQVQCCSKYENNQGSVDKEHVMVVMAVEQTIHSACHDWISPGFGFSQLGIESE